MEETINFMLDAKNKGNCKNCPISTGKDEVKPCGNQLCVVDACCCERKETK